MDMLVKRQFLGRSRRLPEYDERKITFELIDEYPIMSLPRLLNGVEKEGIRLTQINLVCRVDDITLHENVLNEILSEARRKDIRIMFSSIGFESFSEKILRNFNKGITMEDIVKCVNILREMKGKFGNTILIQAGRGCYPWFYSPNAVG